MECNCDLSNSRGSFIIRHPILFHCTVIGVILVVFLCVSSLVILSKCLIPNRKILLKVPSPPVPEPKHAGIKLDTDSARAALVDVMRFPQELEDYNKWIKISDANAKRMSHVCEIATDALIYYLHNRDTAHGKNALTSAQELYVRISKRFDAHFNLKSRVSPRWYPSDFTITTFLAMYLLIPDTSSKDGAAKLVLDLIKKPDDLFSHSVSIHNSPMLVGPWLLAHEQLGTLDEALNHSSYHLVLKYLDFDITTSQGSAGLHRDLSHIQDTGYLHYTNLWRMCRNNYAYTFLLTEDLRKRSPTRLWERITRTIYHERIPITLWNLSTKTNKQATEVYPGTKWGLHVMPFSKILRYFTKDVNFMVHGQDNCMATNDDSVPMEYWTQLRQVFHREDDPEAEIKYPFVGLLTDSNANLSQLRNDSIKVRGQTDCGTVAFSYVFQYMNYGVLQQIRQGKNFTHWSIHELIFIDESEKNLIIWFEFLDLSQSKITLKYYPTTDYSKAVTLQLPGHAVVKTTYNFHTKKYASETIPPENLDVNKEISKLTNDKLTIQTLKDKRGAIVYREEKPIIYAPSLLENETEEVTITSDSYATGVFPTATFKFNKDLNQYCSEFA
uniref:Hsp-16.1 protein n=1 Tax=Fopius arisanus TaxID=64838 RepID=A0A0C9PT74_9HYME